MSGYRNTTLNGSRDLPNPRTNIHVPSSNSEPMYIRENTSKVQVASQGILYSQNSQASGSSGPDSQVLLCSESGLSSSPPSDDSFYTTQERESHGAKSTTERLYNSTSPTRLQTVIIPADSHSALKEQLNHSVLSSLQFPVRSIENSIQNGDDDVRHQLGEKRMNTNGLGRQRITGSSVNPSSTESSSWQSECPPPQSHRTTDPSMLAGQTSSLHDTLLTHSSLGSLYRSSGSVGEVSQRRMPGSHYGSSGSALSPFSSVHPVHGHSASHISSISPYSAFYQHLPSGYSHGALGTTAHYPQIESYSAVLASMGSHASNQSQLPRSPYLSGHSQVAHYSPLSSHRGALTSTNTASPGSNIHSGSSQSMISPRQELLHFEDQHKLESHVRRSSSSSMTKEEKLLSSSVRSPTRASNSSAQEFHKEQVSTKDSSYRLPSGKEGSLKHRILTRPADITIQGSAFTDLQCSTVQGGYSTEVACKRLKREDDYSILEHTSRVLPISESLTAGTSSSSPQTHTQLRYPTHFMKGSIIQLAVGDMKRVEDLKTDDFVHSAEISNDLKIDSSKVVRICENFDLGTAQLEFLVGDYKVQVTTEATLEHPFFVFDRGWSSCSPERTLQRYGLECHKLSEGDLCISLTHNDVSSKAAELRKQQTESLVDSPHRLVSKISIPDNSKSAVKPKITSQQRSATQTRHDSCGSDDRTESQSLRKRRWSAPDNIGSASSDTEAQPETTEALSDSESKKGDNS